MRKELAGTYTIKQAVLNDMEKIINLLRSTARWLQEGKINQWQYLLDDSENGEIRRAILEEETFIIEKDHLLVATFTLYLKQNEWDKELWGINFDNAVYLHRLAISRNFMGEGLGWQIIEWIKEYLKTRNIPFLRLDCVSHNDRLNQFYEGCGLEKVKIVQHQSLFQKIIL